MKKFFSLILSCFVTIVLMAQPPKGPANAGMTFGEKITSEGVMDASGLKEIAAQDMSVEVKLEGVVNQVCTKEGCWIKMKVGDNVLMVKMKDHGFLVPLSLNNKTVIVKGMAENKITTVEMLQHYAEDAGKSKEEIAAIKEPKQEMVIHATGILVVK